MNCDCGGRLELLTEEQRYECVACKASLTVEEYEFAQAYFATPTPAHVAQPPHLQLIQGPSSFVRHLDETRIHAARLLDRPPEADASLAAEQLKRALDQVVDLDKTLGGLSRAFPGLGIARDHILAAWGDVFLSASAATQLATEAERG